MLSQLPSTEEEKVKYICSLDVSDIRKRRMPSLKHVFILAAMRWMVWCETEAAHSRKMFCTFKEKTYSPGESWHPYLEPFGFMFCMRCACTESGHVKCNPVKCPTLRCDNPVTDSQQCCPRCADEQRPPAGLRAPVKTCHYNGTTYQMGETFTNHDLFPSRQSNQCVMCTCSASKGGNIFCALKTCQPITCSSPISVPDTCCFVCKEGPPDNSYDNGGQQLNRGVRHSMDQCPGEQVKNRATRVTPAALRGSTRGLNLQTLHLKGAADTTVKILLQRKHQRACMYSGKTYSHGDVWHPVLGKVLECILCTCRDGLQECRRLTCPSQYPCKHPTKIEGKCCKICPESTTENNRIDCYLGQDNNSLLVYKVESSSAAHEEDTVRKIAIERQGATEIEVQVWKTVDGVLHLMETGDVQKKDLIEYPENYILLTTLDEDTWRKFKEEEDKEKDFSRNRTCEDGIKEVVKYLNPDQLDILCTS
ncbi:chordin-like protein 2 isoform X1 [Silurus meridionalis]|uniref:chordin-like protein 2 isoform X1 n=1 Tax=Silurus meridionalis TaxID=175797 RepID=UPI001EEA5450|nr:chordin-like protein 2 isoform X1 [Silurus meridionalis]